MFTGEYSHSVDEKGRLIIPSKFREELGSTFVIAKGLDGCLSVYPNDEWKKFEEKLSALPYTDVDARRFSRYMLAGAVTVELDKQGRILIPSNLRSFASLDKDVVLIGVGMRAEIWNRARWEGVSLDDDMDEITSKMSAYGI